MTQQTFKWLKRLILVLAIIPVLLFLAFAGAVSLIDFNQYKPQIEKEVSELTQHELQIEGSVDVSILPFMFNVGKLSLKNPPDFAEENLLTVRDANIQISLRKLFLEKKLEIASLELIEPKIHFIQGAKENNWRGIPVLAKLMDSSFSEQYAENHMGFDPAYLLKTAVEKPLTTTDATESDADSKWFLESLVIKNAEISYSHLVQDFTVTLKRANLISFDIRPGHSFKVNSDFVYQHSQSPRTFDFEVNGNLMIANEFTQAHLSDWNGVFRLQLPEERNLPDIRLNTSGKNLMIDFQHQQVYVKDALLNGLDSEVLTSFQGEFGVDPAFQGVFSAKRINIKNWIEHLGLPAPEMKDEKALTNAGGKFNFSWDGKILKLENIDAELDDSQISGRVEIPIKSDAYRFDLQVRNLNTERYLAKSPQGDTFYPVPLTFLKKWHADGVLQVENIQFNGIKADTLKVNVMADNGSLMLAPLDVEFAKGVLLSKLELVLGQQQQAPIKFFWKGRTDDLPISQLAANPTMDGVLNSRFALKSTGVTDAEWLANLNGSVQADIAPARIKGFDLNSLLGGEIALSKKPEATQLTELSVIGQIEQGVFAPKRLQLEAARFSASGTGSFDFARNQLQGELKLNLHSPAEKLQELQGAILPVLFTGKLASPQWSLNIAEIDPAMAEKSPMLQALMMLAK